MFWDSNIWFFLCRRQRGCQVGFVTLLHLSMHAMIVKYCKLLRARAEPRLHLSHMLWWLPEPPSLSPYTYTHTLRIDYTDTHAEAQHGPCSIRIPRETREFRAPEAPAFEQWPLAHKPNSDYHSAHQHQAITLEAESGKNEEEIQFDAHMAISP